VIGCFGSQFDPDFQLVLLKKGVNEESGDSFPFYLIGEKEVAATSFFGLKESEKETRLLDLLEMFKPRARSSERRFSIAPTGVFLSLKTRFIRRVVQCGNAEHVWRVSGRRVKLAFAASRQRRAEASDLPHLPDSWREQKSREVRGNNRSVMPLEVLGCTRDTLTISMSFFKVSAVWRCGFRLVLLHRGMPLRPSSKGAGKLLNDCRAGDWRLQLFAMNEEFLVIVLHQSTLNTSLLYVHTARRSY